MRHGLLLASLAACNAAAAPPAPPPSAAQVMRQLLTDLSLAEGVQHNLHSSAAAPMKQIGMAATLVPHAGRTAVSVYVAAGIESSVESSGVRMYHSVDLETWAPAGLLSVPAAADPCLFEVTGSPPLAGKRWWVLAYESAGQVHVSLFTDSDSLMAARPARVFVAPSRTLYSPSSRTAVVPAGYGSPTIYSAVYSRRGGRTTVDVVMSVTWQDSDRVSHPASALLAALSPDSAQPPDYNVQFAFDGQGYAGEASSGAGPMRWESAMRKVVSIFSYTGSSMAFVPCGAGCGDPRDRAGGNADGLTGTQKISLISGVDAAGKGRLLLWGWDPINKVRTQPHSHNNLIKYDQLVSIIQFLTECLCARSRGYGRAGTARCRAVSTDP